jgi:hypothetical protein
MQLLSRRSVVSLLSGSTWGLTSRSPSPLPSPSPPWGEIRPMTTTAVATPLPPPLPSTAPRQLAEYICHWTPSSFRQAIRDTDGQPFLYRGAESNQEEVNHIVGSSHSHSHSHTGIISRNETTTTTTTTTEWIRPEEPLPDLLILETHGYDQRALEYFEGLEQRLISKRVQLTTNNIINNNNNNSASPFFFMAMPSNGHIATSDPHEASKWGTMVVSVWPVGSQWSYVWPRNRSVFYDYNDDHRSSHPPVAVGHVTTRSSSTATNHHHHQRRHDVSSFSSDGSHDDDDDDDALMINTGIQDALHQPREVLFATTGWTSQTILHQIPQGKQSPTGPFPTSTVMGGEGATRQDVGTDTTTITNTISRIVAPSAFLAVPMDRDNELRQELEALNYGLTTRGDGTKGLFGMPGTPIGW